MSTTREKLTRAVERSVGGPVEHAYSVPIIEKSRGQVVWEGVVEVYQAAAPPPAFAYGWTVEGDQEPQYVAILGLPPVVSALGAVQAWIASQATK